MQLAYVSKLILGCGNFGGIGSLPELYGKGDSQSAAFQILDLARVVGINRFDTANSYGGGASEKILGAWISRQGKDYAAKIEVATKVGNPSGSQLGGAPLSNKEIVASVERSLNRLCLDKVDVLYLHEMDAATPIEDIIATLEKLLLEGKVNALGLSNVTLQHVADFLNVAAGTTVAKNLKFVQNEFHFLHQGDKENLLPFLVEKDLNYVAYSPLAGGLLTGKYSSGLPFQEGSRLSLRRQPYERYLNEETFGTIEKFRRDADKLKIKMSQAALQYVLETEGVAATIIGPRKREHYEDLGFKFC